MTTRSPITAACAALLAVIMNSSPVWAADIRVLCANGMQTVMEDLGRKFEAASGHKAVIAFATGGATVTRAQSNEPADVVITVRPGIDDLVKDGKAVADSVTRVAHTGISVAVRKGAPKPDISTPDAFKRALLTADSLTYLDPKDGGASGIHVAQVLDRLGIANDVRTKTVLAPNIASVGAYLVDGRAELGVLQYQLLYAMPGIEIVGPLPGDLQATTLFAAAILSRSTVPEAARSLIAFLRTPQAVAAIKAKGMETGPN